LGRRESKKWLLSDEGVLHLGETFLKKGYPPDPFPKTFPYTLLLIAQI
jgi:hypothetical protein